MTAKGQANERRVEPGTDFYLVEERLGDDERAVRDRVREFCDREVVPVINDYWQREEFPFELVPKIAALELAGGTIAGYGWPGLSVLATRLLSPERAGAAGH